MGRKNYKWQFAKSITLLILVPIFIILDIIMCLFEVIFANENKLKNILLINMTLLVCLIIFFFVFVLVGSIMFKKTSFKQDEKAFYQNKIKLDKNNLLKIDIGKMFKIFYLFFNPKKQGVFKSSKLIYYFYTERELKCFIIKNNLLGFLSVKDQVYVRSFLDNKQLNNKKDSIIESINENNKVKESINQFNKIYELSIDEIWKLDNINSIVVSINSWLDRKSKYATDINNLSIQERNVFIIGLFIDEVNNGGFEQFLFNSSGAFFEYLMSSLKEVGANDIVNIYEETLNLFPKKLPLDENKRYEVLYKLLNDDILKKLSECDKKFYKISSSDIEESIYSYIMKNKSFFTN